MFKFLCGLFLIILTACTTVGANNAQPEGAPTETASVMPVPTFTPTVDPFAPTPGLPPATYFFFEPGVNPLTGLPVSDPAIMRRRPVMVKVSNWPRTGRPHAGLSQADIVFEYYIGHQMNRFTALYYGQDADQIGPIRSGRLADAQLAQLYQSLLAYGNADPQVDAVLVKALGPRALAFNNLPCPAMCGESTYGATGVFANSSALTTHALAIGLENSPPDLRGFFFQSETPEADASGEKLRLEYANFSIMQWTYDREVGKYNLWMEAESEEGLILEAITDRNTGEILAFDNLVVMAAEYIEYAPSLHDIVLQEAQALQPAMLFRDGLVISGTWRTPDPNRPIMFETPDHHPMPFKQGKTWIMIVGMSSSIFEADAGEWQVYFNLP